MSGYLTTHVLDTARGCPASGLKIDLFRIEEAAQIHLRSMTTNSDGRTDSPILPSEEFALGSYELVFHAGAYLEGCGAPSGENGFLNIIPIRFEMSEHSHSHVPLLLSPFGYSTYRGS